MRHDTRVISSTENPALYQQERKFVKNVSKLYLCTQYVNIRYTTYVYQNDITINAKPITYASYYRRNRATDRDSKIYIFKTKNESLCIEERGISPSDTWLIDHWREIFSNWREFGEVDNAVYSVQRDYRIASDNEFKCMYIERSWASFQINQSLFGVNRVPPPQVFVCNNE